ncbi:protein phosphatase 2c-like domain-containing protein 1 [Plakobranchus ocellatus]|uniref:Protein phosphatase 2c-like domain-containing protein 1 n=1 Tax=Plakobranchus ocellatus TaxID=259542 RepID=A0AAV3Z528_9GAST|nr:protein phosphatase 2c-like domain-containing protein 1 [Plakobranchus ocellatus]
MAAVATPRTRASTRMLKSIPENSIPYNTESFKGKEIKRSDTPETLLTDFSNRPDISIYCERCAVYVDIRNLHYHRTYHEALLTLNYRHSQKPHDVQALLQRRNIILKKMKAETNAENPLRPQDVKKIDDAFEILKSDLEDTYEEVKQVHEKIDSDVRPVSLNCSPACAYAVGMCSSENNRWKSRMEDYKVYQDYFGEDRNKCYLAVFDGHHGEFAAERSASEMHHLLLGEMAKFDSKTKSTTARNFAESISARRDYEQLRPETRDSFRVNLHQDSTEIVKNIMDMCNAKYEEMMKDKKDENDGKKKKSHRHHPFSDKMHKALKKTYLLMDILLSYGKDEMSKVRWSGTSAVTVVIQSTNGNKGDNKDEGTRLDALEEEVSGSGSQDSPRRATRAVEPPIELGMIHVANAGSSRALLIRDAKAYRLTRDHTPYNLKERDRVLAYGGKLSSSEKDCRVNGVLSVTRSLGNHGDKKLKDCVIVDPYVTSVPIDQYAQILVLASAGVWDVLSDEEVTSLLVKLLPSEQIPPPSRVSESLLPLFRQPRLRGDSASNKSGSHARCVTQQEQEEENEPPASPTKGVSFSKETTAIEPSAVDDVPTEVTGVAASGDPFTSQNGIPDGEENMAVTEAGQIREETSKAADILVVSNGRDEENKTKLILADMQTEIGSRMSDSGQDASLHQGELNGQHDQFVSVDEHSDIPEAQPLTVEDLHREMAGSMAEYLTQAALLAGSRKNITVMVVLLPGCGID